MTLDQQAKELRDALDHHDEMRRTWRTHIIPDDSPIYAAARERLAQLEGGTLLDLVWQFNEAVSLMREVRLRAALPEELGEEIDDGLSAMQSTLEAVAALDALVPLPDRTEP